MTSPLGAQPLPPVIQGISAPFTSAWAGWFSVVQRILQSVSTSGPTANRPTAQLFVGQRFFDTTLGLPVWVKNVGPPAVWINGAGVPS